MGGLNYVALDLTGIPKNSKERKKAFLSDQCKEIKENNRMGKTRDLFKKTGITK